jgi:small subunit ribosomal protein S16
MVTLRFNRIGRPKAYFLQLVATDKRNSRDGKPIEVLGTFNPHDMVKPSSWKPERFQYWLSVGAQPSQVVVETMKTLGVWKDLKPKTAAAAK